MGNFKDIKARLEDREACRQRLGYKEVPTKTKKDVDDFRKQEIIDNLTKKYGQVTVGIHGQELPKFANSEQTKEFWRFAQTYNNEPDWTSATELREN